jgi:HEAT repeat protein
LTKKKGSRTVEEILADPEIAARQAEALALARDAEEKERQETAGLRAELAAVGIDIDLVWDLVNSRRSFPEAIPILLKHLGRPYDDRTREGIARALTDKVARRYARELIEAFQVEDDSKHHFVKWAIGNALTVTAARNHLPEIINLALDPKHGKARAILLLILHRSTKPEAKAAILQLLSDPDPDVRRAARGYALKNTTAKAKQ